MRTKIRFDRNVQTEDQADELIVLESSEVDPGVVMNMQEETYDLAFITAAHKKGFHSFQSALRRRGFFPAHEIMEKLFQETKDFFQDESQKSIVVEYNDVESLPDEDEFLLDDTDVELDELLDEDGDTKEDEIKEIDSEDDTPRFTPEDTSEHEN